MGPGPLVRRAGRESPAPPAPHPSSFSRVFEFSLTTFTPTLSQAAAIKIQRWFRRPGRAAAERRSRSGAAGGIDDIDSVEGKEEAEEGEEEGEPGDEGDGREAAAKAEERKAKAEVRVRRGRGSLFVSLSLSPLSHF